MKILFILGLYKFLAYLECIRSYTQSFDHQDLYLSSMKFYLEFTILFFLRYAQPTSAFNSTQLWCMSFAFFAMSNFINSDTQMQQPVLIQLCLFLVFWFLLKPWLSTRLRGLYMDFSCFVMLAWLFSLLLMPTILV